MPCLATAVKIDSSSVAKPTSPSELGIVAHTTTTACASLESEPHVSAPSLLAPISVSFTNATLAAALPVSSNPAVDAMRSYMRNGVFDQARALEIMHELQQLYGRGAPVPCHSFVTLLLDQIEVGEDSSEISDELIGNLSCLHGSFMSFMGASP